MDSNNDDNSGIKLLSSSLPASITKRAAPSVLAVIGGGARYLSAWLRRPTQAVDDVTDARSLVTQLLAEEVANNIKSDPIAMAAAVEKLAPSYVRRETNKLFVAEASIKELHRQHQEQLIQAAPEEAEIDPDWLNNFERFAEDASTKNMQQLWGRVLAGEIGKPGTFSKSTLRFLHELDSVAADLFETVRDYAIKGMLFIPESEQKLLFSTLLDLEGLGIILKANTDTTWQMIVKERGSVALAGNTHALILFGDEGHKFELKNHILTRVGKELTLIVPNRDEPKTLNAMAAQLASKGGKAAAIAKLASNIAQEIEVERATINMVWGEVPHPF